MPGTVHINPMDFRDVLYKVRLTLDAVKTWGMLNPQSRLAIEHAAADVVKCCSQIASLRSASVEVTAVKVRAAVIFLERLTAAVHSARKVMTDDRRRALGNVAAAKRKLVAYIQLALPL